MSRVAVAAVLFLALSVATPASAQADVRPQVSLELGVPDTGRIFPGNHTFPLTVSVECAPPKVSGQVLTYTVTLDAVIPIEGMSARVEPGQVAFDTGPQHCTGAQRIVHEAVVHVDIEPDVPAATEIPLMIEANGPDNMRAQAYWQDVRVAAFLDTTVEAPRPQWKAAPNHRIEVPVTVRNDGNDVLHVAIRIEPDSSEHLTAALPGEFLVDPRTSLAVVILIQTPYGGTYVDQVDVLRLNVTTTASNQPEMHESHTLEIEVETVGTYLPGPGAALVVAALLLLGLAARRRAP